jgi:hypothetical protein
MPGLHRIATTAFACLAAGCGSGPSPVVRAASIERLQCEGTAASQGEVALLDTAAVLHIEPLYSGIFDASHAIEKQVIGAKLLVRPPKGVTPDEMRRALQCHSARILLGRVSPSAVPDDPYWLPDAWVDIDVKPENGNYAVTLSADTTVRDNLQILAHARRYASDHMVAGVAVQPSMP